jgi:hypothetical protein
MAESQYSSVDIATRLVYTAFDSQLEKSVFSSQRNSTLAL